MERPEIPVGAVRSMPLVVGEGDLASVLSGKDQFPGVFATSRMIALMELAAARVLGDYLRPGEMSVGVAVNVKHTAATPPGSPVQAEARYLGREDKLYAFEVIARDEAGEIGRGTHHRAIVEIARLLESARRRALAGPRPELP